jgi:hypothetical protein
LLFEVCLTTPGIEVIQKEEKKKENKVGESKKMDLPTLASEQSEYCDSLKIKTQVSQKFFSQKFHNGRKKPLQQCCQIFLGS